MKGEGCGTVVHIGTSWGLLGADRGEGTRGTAATGRMVKSPEWVLRRWVPGCRKGVLGGTDESSAPSLDLGSDPCRVPGSKPGTVRPDPGLSGRVPPSSQMKDEEFGGPEGTGAVGETDTKNGRRGWEGK